MSAQGGKSKSAERTKRYIKRAFSRLLKTKSLEKITVSEIIQEADVCRSTFYAHYQDVFDLYSEVEGEIFEYFDDLIKEKGLMGFLEKPEEIFECALNFVGSNKDDFSWFAYSDVTGGFLAKLAHRCTDTLIHEITVVNPSIDTEHARAVLTFIFCGIKDVLIAWLADDIGMNAKELSEYLCQMIRLNRIYIIPEAVG